MTDQFAVEGWNQVEPLICEKHLLLVTMGCGSSLWPGDGADPSSMGAGTSMPGSGFTSAGKFIHRSIFWKVVWARVRAWFRAGGGQSREIKSHVLRCHPGRFMNYSVVFTQDVRVWVSE